MVISAQKHYKNPPSTKDKIQSKWISKYFDLTCLTSSLDMSIFHFFMFSFITNLLKTNIDYRSRRTDKLILRKKLIPIYLSLINGVNLKNICAIMYIASHSNT